MSSLLALSIRGVRAFDSKSEQTIEFKKPLTVILGPNGCGKTTVIECLRFATTGQLPPGSMSGKAFVHDCKVEETSEVKASVKLLFEMAPGGNRYMSVRNMQLTQKKKTSTFKQIDGVLRHIPVVAGVRGRSKETTQKCAQLSTMIPGLLRISRAVLDNVIFCHQEDACWPLSQGSELKKRFDAIFESTRYTKALEAIIKERKQQVMNSKEIKAELDVQKVHLQAFHKLSEDKEDIEARLKRMKEAADGHAGRMKEATAQRDMHLDRCNIAKVKRANLKELETELSFKRDELERVTADLTNEMEDDLDDLVKAKENYASAEGDRKKRLRSMRSEQRHKENRVRAMRLKLNSLATTRGEHQGAVQRAVAHAREHTAMRNRYVSEFGIHTLGGHAQIDFDSPPASSNSSGDNMAANMAAAVADSKSVLHEMKSLKDARADKLSMQQQKGREACDEIQQRVSDARGKVSVVEAQIKAGKEAKTQLDHERRSLKDSLRKYTRNTEAMSRKTEQHEQACLEAQNRVKEFESKKSVETLRQSKTEVRAWDVRLKNKEEQIKDRLRLLLKHQSTVEQLSNEKNTLTSELASLKDNAATLASDYSEAEFGNIGGGGVASMDVDVDMDEAEGSSGGDHATSGNMAEGVAAVTDFAKAAAETVADKEVAIERKFAGAEKKSRAKTKAFNTVETLWSSKKEAFARIGHECADVEGSLVEAFHKLSLESLLPGGHEGIDLDDENLATMFTDDVMKEAASEMKERLSSVQASSNLYQSFQELCDTALKLVSKKHKCMLCERGFGCYDDDIDEAGYIAQVQKLKKQSLEKSANKDVHNETAQAEQQLAEFNSAKDNLFLPLRLKMKQLKKMKKDLDVLAQKRDAAEGEHSAAAEMLASLKEQYDAIQKLDQQGRLLLRQIKSVQAAHKKVTELQEMLPTSANPIAMVGSDDDDNGNNDDDAGASGPSSLPDLSTNLKKISNDLVKANSIEDMESLEHRVGRLRSEVQNCVERIEHEIDVAMKESKRLNDALQLERNKQTKHLETVREQQVLSAKLETCETKLSKTAEELDDHTDEQRTLKRELVAAETDLNERRSEMEDLENQLRGDLDAAKNALVSFDTSHKQLVKDSEFGAAEKLSACDEDIRKAEADRNAVQVQMKEVQPRIDELEAAVNQGEVVLKTISENIRAKQLDRLVDELDEKVEKAKAEYKALNIDEDVQEVNRLNAQIAEMEMAQAKEGGSKSELKKQLSQCRQELSDRKYRNIENEVRKSSIAFKTVEMAARDLDRYHGALDSALQSYHSIKVREINSIIKEIWQLCYKGGDIDMIELRSDPTQATAKRARSYNYRVVMTKGNTALDMRGRCSAGQKQLASLVIRMALAETFCVNCGILALDEPTTNLDEENKAGLCEALSSIIEARSRQENFQLICITHDEQFIRMLARAQGDHPPEFYYTLSRSETERGSGSFVSHITKKRFSADDDDD